MKICHYWTDSGLLTTKAYQHYSDIQQWNGDNEERMEQEHMNFERRVGVTTFNCQMCLSELDKMTRYLGKHRLQHLQCHTSTEPMSEINFFSEKINGLWGGGAGAFTFRQTACSHVGQVLATATSSAYIGHEQFHSQFWSVHYVLMIHVLHCS